MKIAYVDHDYQPETQYIIGHANRIIAGYQAQGYQMTMRQLYYRFIALDLFPESWRALLPGDRPKHGTGSKNNERSYKRLLDMIANARMSGDVDWDAIVDRTREVNHINFWSSPAQILRAVANQYNIDMWSNQYYRPIVLVEKEALIEVVARTCLELDVPHGACKGYMSASSMHELALKLVGHIESDQEPVIIHLGDLDPSGLDMSGDIDRRLTTFVEHHVGQAVEVNRIALNIDQVEQYNPPPSPAKMKDSRVMTYVELYGHDTWELDALEPNVLDALIRDAVLSYRDDGNWDEKVEERDHARNRLRTIADEWRN